MEIVAGDAAILYTGPQILIRCKIPEAEGEIPVKQQAANVKDKRVLHRKGGIFDLRKVLGKQYGQKFFWDSVADRWSVLLQPTCELITRTVTHRTQILYRADISLAVMLLDLYPGKRVLECGTGSGSLSYTLATTVAPTGHVFTFDFHNQRKQYAEDFFAEVELTNYITAYDRDAYSTGAFLVDGAVWESSIDSVFFDLPSPWDALDNAKTVLKNFGKLVTFSPTVEQSQRMSKALSDSGFIEIKTFEILCKPWGIGFDETDDTQFACYQLSQLSHTGYLTVSTLLKC
ncbi:tRNA (adenine(58)-N(1))-methyltransferase catalytic subunit TRMT61A [Babesia sp. Xinjiang]|uniref:tRNA (adenine(58)-N(1))-methyltransferase catalytic subunit TRMT61A n=1 Tax=Babesia sp. Xinjiang TaxID=462227 RepID=UPI000A21C81A|nr:tRNA (adenine(58)-N(1))-methyltransferase catalytic subunit TRMT61A [Babesia sp. Xinjiang]ORM41684.1 tRNA (adenine(58)-N(1))-methyltransferase catalytic subunit TRMT61A [Babesia sp. Xinjiang]